MLIVGATIVTAMLISTGEPDAAKSSQPPEANQVTIEQFEGAANSEALGQKAWQLWAEHKYGEAAKQFVEAIKIDPESPNLWNGLGWSLLHTGKTDKAADAFKQTLTLDASWQPAINGLGQIAYAKREYEHAKEWFLKAPDAPAAQQTLIAVYLLTGEYEQAAELSEKMLATLPEQSEDESIQFQKTWLTELHDAAVAKQIPETLRRKIEPAKPAEPQADTPDTDATTGHNLLTGNAGFEQGAKGWIIGDNSGRMELTPDKNAKTEGKQSLRITKTGGMPVDIVRINVPDITPGQTVDVSAKLKSKDAGNAWMKFFVWDADGNVLIEKLDVTRIHGTQDWRKAAKQFKLPEQADSAAVQFWMVMDGTVWIDDVRVEPVNPPTTTPTQE